MKQSKMIPPFDKKSYWEYQERVFKKIGVKYFIDKNILDVGCGFGENSKLISMVAKKTIAIDKIRYSSWEKFKNFKLFFIVGDSINLPFNDSEFDAVYARNLLHHVKNPQKHLIEMGRVVKPNGTIIIAEANRYNPIFWIHMTKILKHDHFTQQKFKNLLQTTFKNVYLKNFEAQYYPTDINLIHKIEILWEQLFEKFSIFRSILSYNVGIIKKPKEYV